MGIVLPVSRPPEGAAGGASHGQMGQLCLAPPGAPSQGVCPDLWAVLGSSWLLVCRGVMAFPAGGFSLSTSVSFWSRAGVGRSGRELSVAISEGLGPGHAARALFMDVGAFSGWCVAVRGQPVLAAVALLNAPRLCQNVSAGFVALPICLQRSLIVFQEHWGGEGHRC